MSRTVLIVGFFIFVSFSVQKAAFAQATGGGDVIITPSQQVEPIPPQNLEPPQGVGDPSDFPPSKDIPRVNLYPEEDLNPYDLSTLGGSTSFGEREDASTLGGGNKRKSNLEVNKPRERKKTNEETQQSTVEESFVGDETYEEPANTVISSGGGLYKWVDKNGVIHVTNDLGSIPPEYRDQIMNQSQENQETVQP